MTMKPYSEELKRAYKETDFRADTPRGAICIRVDEIHSDLDLVLHDHNAREWAYITAYNPGSNIRTAQTNQRRHEELVQMVGKSGHKYFHGRGVGKDPAWEPEESLLIIGPGRKEAIRIGQHFGQNAIVCGALGSPAELVHCYGENEGHETSRQDD